jgi:parallel beta-helix repeat protein
MPFESQASGNMSAWTKDYSNRSNHGKVTGATWNSTGGYDGRGVYDFDGSTAYINISTSSDFNSAKPFTASLWFKVFGNGGSSSDTNTQTILVKGYDTQYTAWGMYYEETQNRVVAYIRDSALSYHYVYSNTTDSSEILENQLAHLVFLWNGSNISLYINGTLKDTATAGTAPANFGTADVYAGSIPHFVTQWRRWYNGSLDSLMIYNRSLTPEQVAAIYLSKTDLVVSQETTIGDVWRACVTPNDGYEEGIVECSGAVNVTGNPLPCVNLSDPATWEGQLYNAGSTNRSFYVINNVTLCTQAFLTDTARPLFIINNSYTLDCNNSRIAGIGSGTAVLATSNNSRVQNCVFEDFGTGVNVIDINSSGGGELFNLTFNFTVNQEYLTAVAVDYDGNYVLAGWRPILSQYYWQVRKISPQGDTIWFSNYSSEINMEPEGVVVDHDGNYVVVGSSTQAPNGVGWRVMKFSPAGALLGWWNYSVTSSDDELFGVAVDHDNNYVLVGYEDAGVNIAWRIAKITSTGVSIWNRTLDPRPNWYEAPYDIAVDNEGNYVVVGLMMSTNWTVVKMTPDNVLLWNKTFTISGSSIGIRSVAVDYDNNYVLAGLQSSYWRAMKIDSDGQGIWNWTGESVPAMTEVSVAVDQNNDYVMSGVATTSENYSIRKMSTTGSILVNWTHPSLVAYSTERGPHKIVVDKEGNYVVVGDYRSGTLDTGWALVKFAPNTNTMSGVQLQNISVYDSNETMFLAMPEASVAITNLTIGYNSTHGKVRYSSIGNANGTLAHNRTIIVNPWYVSVYGGHADAQSFNAPANLTIQTANCDYNVWRDTGFPTSLAEILLEGSAYTPEDKTCSGYITEFSVDSFSGYTTKESNTPPVTASIVLNSTHNTNFTNENLTVWYSTSDGNGDPYKNITNWYVNGASVMVLNMPLEAHDANASNESVWAKDYTNFSNNATVYTAAWNLTGGYDGRGDYYFDGNDYLLMQDKSHFSPSVNAITIEVWANVPTSAASGGSGVCGGTGRYLAAKGGAAQWEWGIENDQNSMICFSSWNLTGQNNLRCQYSMTLNDGLWHHYAMVISQNSRIEGYVDGQLVCSNYTVLNSMGDGTSPLYIGRRGDGNYFIGDIDSVRIWNRTLSADQVKLLYQNQTDVIHFNETSIGDAWKACVTPNDGYEDGTENCSSTLVISSCVAPYDGFVADSDITLCSGTYYLSDAASDGLIRFANSNIKIACNSTVIIGNGSGYGFYSDGKSGLSLTGCTIRNFSMGIYLNNTYLSNFTNNSLFNNTYGVYLKGSSGNLFHSDNFTGNAAYHAFADSSGNHFNTTNGSSCGALCARGNLWDDVAALSIFDTNADGFGDTGVQYPYNSSFSSRVNVNVTDYGPLTQNIGVTPAPLLVKPANNSMVTDSRNPLYIWNNSVHTISDNITYRIQVDDAPDFATPVFDASNISEGFVNSSYWNATSLQFSIDYYWRVKAIDPFQGSDWSGVFHFNILPTTSCTQPNSEIDFGSMCINPNQAICDANGWGSHINDTLDSHPEAYVTDNDGNLKIRGKAHSTKLWTTPSIIAMPHRYYQYMIGVGETGSYEWALDSFWVNMTNSSSSAAISFHGFKWENATDSMKLHIRLEAPDDEPAGAKYSTTTVTCEQNETYY